MTAPNKMARAAAGTLALAVCLTGGVIGAGAAQAAPNFKFDQRVAGDDRMKTAVEASKRAFPNAGDAGAIVLVNKDAVVDGLAAAYVAGLRNAPILFVDRDGIPNETSAEIKRFTTKNIVIVGGTTVVPEKVANELTAAGHTVVRHAGDDRYATAAAVATSGTAAPGKVFVASGISSADALVVSPIAFNKKYPILLTLPGSVPAPTRDALSKLNVNTRLIVGGTAVIDGNTYNALGGTRRLAGEDRQGTAIEVADYAIADEGFATDTLGLVGGQERNSVDSLSGSPVAGKFRSPLLFTSAEPVGINPATTAYLQRRAAQLTGAGYVYGGVNAVTPSSADKATAAAGGSGTTTPGGSNQRIAVAPNTTESRTLANDAVGGTNTQADADRDNRVFTASGLENGKTYRITLVDSRNIAVENAGVATFKSEADPDSRSGFSVDIGEDDADITRVNGDAIATTDFATAAQAGRRTITARPVNGNITFEIDGQSVGDVTPVVYLNGSSGTTDAEGGTSIRLETSATSVGQFSAPTEPFGLGGKTTFDGVQATDGTTATNAGIETVVKENNFFNTEPTAGTPENPATPAIEFTPGAPSQRFNYDENDTFSIGGAGGAGATEVDLAAFEAALSSADTISVTNYSRSADRSTSFVLGNVNPARPTVTAEKGTGSSENDITLTGSTTDEATDLDQFVIQRAVVTNPGASEQVGAFITIATIAAGDNTPTDNTSSATTAATAGTQFRYVDNDRPSGSFQYRVAGLNDGDTGTFSVPTATQTVNAADSTAPTVIDTRLANNTAGPNALALEAGESFTIVATEPFAVPTGGAAAVVDDPATVNVDETRTAGTGDVFRLQDGDGTQVDLINGQNATFTRNRTRTNVGGVEYAPNQVLTVTIVAGTIFDDATGTPTDGTTEGLGATSTLVSQSGNTDFSGNPLQLTGDVIVDSE